ncbi:MAG: hypothetical protein L0220_02015 [Acidobacteria bacterium]|nr:hypothetical protein [Acidobacteriota bacterium]
MLTRSSLLLLIVTANFGSTMPSRVDINEQINKTVTLAPGSNVKINGINGRVTIVTGEGDKAEIDISIRASDREALDRRPLLIEETANSLTIRTDERREERRGGDRGWVRHEVNLKLPRDVNLRVNGVNGAVDVGQIAGEVGLNGINGKVSVAQAGTATHINGINGHTTISLLRLGEGGLRVSGCNGGVSIGLPVSTNANIRVHGINGGVDTDLPITLTGEIKRGQLTGTIGSGGATIEITGINGGVQLRRN